MTMDSWLLEWRFADAPQPLLADLGRDSERATACWLTKKSVSAFLEGYLFDRQRLCADLGLASDSSDTLIALQGYRRWGDDLADRLRGGFFLAIWDAPRQRLLVVRDAMGLHPCYFLAREGLFLASSEIEAILSNPAIERMMNRERVAEFMMVSYPEQRLDETLFEGVRRLLPGHQLSLADGRIDIHRYWQPLPEGFSWATEEEVDELPPRLEQAVGRCLGAGANSLALSGGFDSVSLAILAAEGRGPEERLQALSLRFPAGACDEGAAQTAVARALAMPLHMLTIEESLDGADPFRVLSSVHGSRCTQACSGRRRVSTRRGSSWERVLTTCSSSTLRTEPTASVRCASRRCGTSTDPGNELLPSVLRWWRARSWSTER